MDYTLEQRSKLLIEETVEAGESYTEEGSFTLGDILDAE